MALPEGLDVEARQLVMAHEMTHVRNAHYGWALAERCMRAAFLRHPLVHAMGQALALDRERQAVRQALNEIEDTRSPTGNELCVHLQIRKDAVDARYRLTIAAQEQRRLNAMRERMRSDG